MSKETKIRNDSVEQYAIEIRNDSDQQAVRIKSDGSIIFGEGFTVDSAAREFWLQIGKLFPTMFVPVDNLSALVAELSEAKALMDCGHPKVCWVSCTEPHRYDEPCKGNFCTICAELSRREADLHKMYNERMDALNERFDQQRMREQAEAKAGCAALLEKAAKASGPYSILAGLAVRAIIPTDAAAALVEEKRKERQEIVGIAHDYMTPHEFAGFVTALAELRAEKEQ